MEKKNTAKPNNSENHSSEGSISSVEVEVVRPKTVLKTPVSRSRGDENQRNEGNKTKAERKDNGDSVQKKNTEKNKHSSSDDGKPKSYLDFNLKFSGKLKTKRTQMFRSPADSENSKNIEDPTGSKKRKRRRKPITICTSNCRYEVVRRVAYTLGMKEVPEDESWNLFWTDLSISVERCKEMKRFQKINHFPGMSEICRKDLLARNLNRMLKIFPKDYCFFPKTWCLPADMGDLQAYARVKRNKTYILKPDMGCQGRGIYLTKSVKDLKPQEKMICQVYISKPFLIDGYKFDFRVYTLITSCDPLRIFVYNDGLVRFATSRYREPTGHNTTNVYMHLTNYAVNKHSRTYVVDDELGSKRKISTLNRWLESKDYDLEDIWTSTDDVIIKTIIAAHPMLKHNYHTCFPTHDYTYACFELLGFDILLDQNLKPYVLEVNHSPSFHCDSQIDRDIKEGLLRDTFEILNLQQCDKKKIMEEDRRRIRERLLQGISKDQNTNETESAPSQNPLQMQTTWEENHKGNFRKIYPGKGSEKYDKFFNQNLSSLFQDTAASRAREEASRVQREESLIKAKQEALRRNGGKLILEKLRPESPVVKTKFKKTLLKKGKDNTELRKVQSSSFEPMPIVESEEMERQQQLKQREFLVRSYGLIEQIYLCLKKNRTLRPEDEAKYGLYGKHTVMGSSGEVTLLKKKFKPLAEYNPNDSNAANDSQLTNFNQLEVANSASYNFVKNNNNINNNNNNSNNNKINENSNLSNCQTKNSDNVEQNNNLTTSEAVASDENWSNQNVKIFDKSNDERRDKAQGKVKEKLAEIQKEFISNNSPEYFKTDLYVNCSKAPISIRPIPSHSWPYSGSNNPPTWASHTGPVINSNLGYKSDIKTSKTQLGRIFANNSKVRYLGKKEKYHFGNLEW